MKTYTSEITIRVELDDCPVRGNALASDDATLDKQVEDEILARLDDGDVWAWACVEVNASFRGVSRSSYLGACSYVGEEDFKSDDGYYAEMVTEACEGLAELIKSLQGVEIEIL